MKIKVIRNDIGGEGPSQGNHSVSADRSQGQVIANQTRAKGLPSEAPNPPHDTINLQLKKDDSVVTSADIAIYVVVGLLIVISIILIIVKLRASNKSLESNQQQQMNLNDKKRNSSRDSDFQVDGGEAEPLRVTPHFETQ